ncbi:putative protein IDA [Helianthus anomalus]
MNLLGWRRSLILFSVLFFFLIVAHHDIECSRTSGDHVFRVNHPNSNFSGNFFGFLPKRNTPLPPSGPSRKHNAVGRP